MTALRVKTEQRTILDFSNLKCSKSGVHKTLKKCNIPISLKGQNLNNFVYYNNEIKVGMFTITLQFPIDVIFHASKLSNQKDFEITISDKLEKINLKQDIRFKNEYWVHQIFFGKFKIKHLVDAIIHCKRLDRLKAFL